MKPIFSLPNNLWSSVRNRFKIVPNKFVMSHNSDSDLRSKCYRGCTRKRFFKFTYHEQAHSPTANNLGCRVP